MIVKQLLNSPPPPPQNYIYAIGGYTSHGYTSSIEQLDVRLNRWEAFTELPVKVGYFGCTLTRSNQVSDQSSMLLPGGGANC